MKILEWPEFQIVHVWILLIVLIVIILIFNTIYYFKYLEKKNYLFFLTISKQKKLSVKEIELLLDFYNYYKQNYSIFTRNREIKNSTLLKKRLLEWYTKVLQNDKHSNQLFLHILRNFFFELRTFAISSIKDLDISEPVFVLTSSFFTIGFVESVEEKPIPKIRINLLKSENLLSKKIEMIFYRSSSGDYKTIGEIIGVEDHTINVIIKTDFEPLSFNLMTLAKVSGKIKFKHINLGIETNEIDFISEKLSLRGIKIYSLVDIKKLLRDLLKEHNIPNIIWEDFRVEIQLNLEDQTFFLTGKIKDIYKSEKNRYLVVFEFQEDNSNMKKILISFIKNNFPIPEKL
jgi:hypothetical protein